MEFPDEYKKAEGEKSKRYCQLLKKYQEKWIKRMAHACTRAAFQMWGQCFKNI